jgi:hypothetical protein
MTTAQDQEELWDEEDDRAFRDGKIRTFHTSGSNGAASTYKPYKAPCYETHPALMIGGKPVYGGSCGHPMVTNADIYVGLDHSMRSAHHYPWNDPPTVQSIYFPLIDGGAPGDPAEFQRMIKWLAMQLAASKLIHVGCIGGHGRTGMVLAALVKEVDGIEDAITYVRQNYCKKAVESATQVAFLNKYFGIKVVPGSRHYSPVQARIGSSRAPALRDAKGEPFRSSADRLWEQMQADKAARGPGQVHRAPPRSDPPVPLALRSSLPTGPIWAAPEASLMSIWGKGPQPLVDKRKKAAKMQVSQEGATNGNHAED